MPRPLLVALISLCSGLSAAVSAAQLPVTFPTVIPVGSQAQALTVPVSLAQGGTIGAIKVMTQGSAGFDFSNSGGGSCAAGVSYLPGQQCSVAVGFRPASPGQRLGAIVLLDPNGIPLATRFLAAAASGPLAVFVPGAIQTVAGNKAWIYSGDGGAATQSAIFLPFGLAVNAGGDIFIADSNNNRIRKVDGVTGIISTIAGNGLSGGGNGGPAVLATLSTPSSIALDPAGNLYFSDTGDNVIRRIDAFTGLISAFAGTLGQSGYTGDSGPADRASLDSPNGLAFANNGDLYFADTGNNVIRMVSASSGIISTVAGTGAASYSGDGAAAKSATLSNPWSVTVAAGGQFFIADQNNNRIRMVDSGGIITTVVGTGVAGFTGDSGPAAAAALNVPASVAIDVAGDLYVADSGNNRVRKVSAQTGIITTIAGGNSQAFSGDSGPANLAGLYGPYTLALDGRGDLFITDVFHNRIREIASNAATLEFPPMRVGRLAAALPQTIENDGNAPLTVENILAIANAQLDGASTTCSPAVVLNVFDTCAMGAAFAPTTTGLIVTGSVNVVNDAMNSPGTITLSGQVLDVDPATVAMTSSLNPSTAGQTVTFTVTVSSAGTTPTGTVSLMDGATALAAGSLQNGISSFTVASLSGGQHTMTASYGGDSSNSAAVSAPLFQIVKDIQAPTVITLASSVNPVNAGAPLSLTATVSVATPGAGFGSITGSVAFTEGTTLLGTAIVNGGSATLAISTLAAGSHSIVATYSGNTTYASSSSSAMVQRVQVATTRVALSSSANPSIAGAALTLSATLLSNGGVPTGTVAFMGGAVTLGSAAINGHGIAALLVPGSAWTVGTHALAATYAGDANDSGSVSQPVSQVVNIATTSVALASSLSPVGLGGQVAFTAAVSGNGRAPSGSVQFMDGNFSLGSATLGGSGSATFSISTLALGSHSIAAVYGGDGLDAGATSNPLIEVVQQATIAISLSTTGNPSNFGAAVTFSANVTGTGSQPAGSVSFSDGTSLLANVPLGANGVAAYTSTTLGIGTHNVVAQYSGDANHAAVASSALVEQIVQATATTLSAGSTRSVAGIAVNFTASVVGANGYPVTGNITFFDGAVSLASVASNANGVALFTTSTLTPGQHNIVARYSGDALDDSSASAASVQAVTIAATSILLSSSVNPAFAGTAVVLTATVTGNGGAPGGSVAFHDGATLLGAAPLSSGGVATLSVSTLTPGIHLLAATYSGDTDDQTSISPPISQQIAEQTIASIASSASPSLLTDAVTITVTVANGVPASPPTGPVTLADGGAAIATALLNGSGIATFNLAGPTLGQHTLIASYAGDSQNVAASSQPFLQTVVLRPTSSSFTPSSTALSAGQQLILITIVQGAGSRAPTGQVTFQSGASTLGSAPINAAGLVTLTLQPAAGAYNLTAQYSGDALYAPSVSAAVAIVVGPPIEFTVSTQAALQLQSGQHATMQVDIASAPTFTDVLSLGCAGLPASATCTFSMDQVSVAGGVARSVTVTVDTGSPLGAGASARLSTQEALRGTESVPLACMLPAGALLALLLFRSRKANRKTTRSAGVLLATLLLTTLASVSVLSGCASSFAINDTPPGSYSFQIVGSGNQTGATQAATVQLTVTK